jgi:formamidopyrimidine-DNA glycosylase
MPEMADVEVLKRRFNEELRGQKITGVQVLNPALVKTEDLEKKLTGQKIQEAQRYAKYLFLKIDAKGWLVVHFGLTGHLVFEEDRDKKIPSSAMLVISTDKLNLIYIAYRVFGSVDWCAGPDDFIREKKLGPDAAAISKEDFVETFHGLKGAVKPALMDQHKVSGIGNVYADEILFQAKIHPQAPLKDLTASQLKEIYAQIHRVHEAAVKVEAVRTKMPDWAIMKVRKTTKACPRCGSKLKDIQLSRRETYVCPKCQIL